MFERRPELTGPALQRLFDEDDELRWVFVVSADLDHQINLGKAAELLGVHQQELREQFIERAIPLRIGSADIAEARAEVEAIRSRFEDPSS